MFFFIVTSQSFGTQLSGACHFAYSYYTPNDKLLPIETH